MPEICASRPATPNQTDINFHPLVVAYGGESVITISTKTFINDFSPWYVKVKIAGIECAAHDIILHTVPIDCVVRSLKKRRGKVLIQQFAKAVVSAKTVRFVDPKIFDIKPKYGPISGGTLITITGQYLYAGKKILAFIGDLPCYINTYEKTYTICKNVQADGKQSLKLRMTFDNVTREYDKYEFRYGDDPTIASVETAKLSDNTPKCIPAGGLDVIVHGTNLKIVQKPSLYVQYGGKRYYSDCVAPNDAVMYCITPTIDIDNNKLNPDSPTKLEFGFMMDGVASVQDLSMKGHAKFQLFPNPVFDQFAEMIKYIENQSLTITGKNLDQSCAISDVRVFIGQYLCNITSLSRSSLVCKPSQLFGANE